MTWSLLIRPSAEQDLRQVRHWYAVEAPEQVDRFEAELDDMFGLIVEHPMMFPVLRSEARRAHLKVFPYDVWYLVHAEPQVVEVIAVVHDRRDRAPVHDRLS
ncbi:MAG: type II toxin-antitoxin system RelE/ParE family toxin [Aeromicrobium sp.]|uniref:type II toxin-antitoxin system RelE/ParE family toxin n=1 Tax=Aeromicrobium sp. TaxID=1871063 RepID=UPI0039E2B49E